MKLVKKLVRENQVGSQLEAVIYQDGPKLSIKYYVNGAFKIEESFQGKDVAYAEQHANSWLSSVGMLNG